MGALEDLTQLVHKGKLTSEVTLEGTVITLSTISSEDELEIYDKLGISGNIGKELETALKNEVVSSRYAILAVHAAVKKVNGQPITKEQVKTAFGEAESPLIMSLYTEYGKLVQRRLDAGKEIKN